MKKELFVILILLLSIKGFAQDTVFVYMNNDYAPVEQEEAKYIREAVITDDHFYITDKLADGTVYNYYELSSLDPQIYDGLSIAYDSNYSIYAKGKYIQNVMRGIWLYYNDEGGVDSVYYPALTSDDKVHKAKYYKKSRKTKEIGYEILDSLSSFMKSNFHLPPRARETGDSFLAKIHFIIGEDGKIIGQEIIAKEQNHSQAVNPESLHPDILQEITRIINLFRYRHSARKSMGMTMNLYYPFPKESEEDVFVVVEDMPEFKSKKYKNSILRYVRENLSNKFSDCSGVVLVHFIVEKDGSIQDVSILRGIENCSGYEEEIKKIFRACPPWKPGMQRNEAVRIAFNLPVRMGEKQ